ncbi:hypothetical protein MTO96_041750, partial [Rhipicephalus appendiculatus]
FLNGSPTYSVLVREGDDHGGYAMIFSGRYFQASGREEDVSGHRNGHRGDDGGRGGPAYMPAAGKRCLARSRNRRHRRRGPAAAHSTSLEAERAFFAHRALN